MGSHFVKTGLGNDVASAQYFDTPQQAFTQANNNLQAAGGGRPNFLAQESQATVTPSDPENPEAAPNIQGGTLAPFLSAKPAELPKIQTPSFLQAQNDPNLANKSETKMGKLFQILGGAAQGAGAGAGSYSFGEGFGRAQHADQQRKQLFNQQQQQTIQNQRQAQADKNSQAEADRQAAEAPLNTKIKQQTIQANDAALAVKNQTPDEIQTQRTKLVKDLGLTGDVAKMVMLTGKPPEDFGKRDDLTPYQKQQLELEGRRIDATLRGQNMTDSRMRDQNAIARETKLDLNRAGDETQLAGVTASMDRLAAAANELMKHPGLPGITGKSGAFPNIPGGQAANAQAKLSTLKSQTAFSTLADLRNQSKTGGALGQISDKEEQMLSDNLAALDRAQSTEEYKNSLQKIIDFTDAAKQRARDAVSRKYSKPGAAPHGGGFDWNAHPVAK